MDEKGYRVAVIVDPGAEQLHPIFTRTVDELAAERWKAEVVPEFWLKQARKYALPEARLHTPQPTAKLVVFALQAYWGAGVYVGLRDARINVFLIAYAVLMLLLGFEAIRNKPSRLAILYLLPLVGMWYGGKESLAAFIRWRRLKAPRDMQETRDRFFAATRAELIGTLRSRLEPVAKGLDASDPRWSLIATAEAYVRACERYFEDWMETEQPRPFSHGCAGKGNVHLYASNSDAREALQRAYLLAHQAVDDAERGPTDVSVDTAVALHGAHDNSPLAFAKTLVPRRYHAK